MSREDMVYPLSGNSASNSEVPPEYLAGESPVVKPLERSTDANVGEISSVVRIRGTVIALVGRIRGRNIRVFVDSGSNSNYISAQCQAGLDLEVQPETDFERLTLAEGLTYMHRVMYDLSFIVGLQLQNPCPCIPKSVARANPRNPVAY